ncbi:MAG TPA: cytochrome c oxidase assembly protein [Acidimicrobiales bacterium]|nr:cytochrome c oxidase assembly protein [Acidimicrobiales bacterium]
MARRAGWRFGAAGAMAGALALHTGDTNLAVHMAEHIVWLYVAPLLLALGWPLRARRPFRLGAVAATAVVHAAVMLVWHLPGPFDAAVRSEALHGVEHLSMLAAGYAFFAVLFGAAPALRPAVAPVLFLASMPGMALGVAMTLAPRPWYAVAPTLADQQLAGVVMWSVGGAVYLAVAVVSFGRWLALEPA